MVIKFILTFQASISQKMISNLNILPSFLLILYLVYINKYYLQVYLDDLSEKIANKGVTDDLEDIFVEA